MMRLLIIEDDVAAAKLLQEQLATFESPQLRVTTASTLGEGLDLGGKSSFDLMLVDLSLPDSSGLETVEQVMARFPHIPVVVLTGRDDQSLAVEAVRRGAQDYLVKGQTPATVVARAVRYAIERNEVRKQLCAAEQELRAANERLESRVRERTREVADALAKLQREAAERRDAEESLRESESRYRELAQSITDVFFSLDSHLRVTYWNKAAEELTGIPAAEAVGQEFGEIFPQVPGSIAEQAYRTALVAKRPCTFLTESHVGNRDIFFEVNVYPLSNGIAIFAKDITRRRQSEEACDKMREELTQAHKMEAIGHFAGGVAHDFRNQLAIIKGYAELLQHQPALPPGAHSYLREILSAADNSIAMAGQLQGLSCQQLLHPQPICLPHMLSNLAEPLSGLLGGRVRLVIEPSPRDLWVEVDPLHLQQAIEKFAARARDSMPEGGSLCIAVSSRIQPTTPDGRTSGQQQAVITFTDTGMGMSPEAMQRVFEPFVSSPQGGMELGLSVAYGFIRQSGGQIDVESHPGHGTIFRVVLPAVPAPAGVSDALAATSPCETILLVDDEAPVRRMLGIALRERGYHVLEAGDGEQALFLGGRHRGTIDLLIADVVMPGISGVELAKRMTSARPRTRVLYISAYTGEALLSRGLAPDGIDLLPKPFSADVLSAWVRSILDRSHEA